LISIELGELTAAGASSLVRPIGTDGMAATAAARRIEIAAGPGPVDSCLRLGELPVGSAVITDAGTLAADFLVHVVVRSPERPATVAVVRRALENTLRRIDEWAIASVAMPPLGTGPGSLDVEESAELMVPLLLAHLRCHASPPRITVVVESAYEHEAFGRVLARQTSAAPFG